MATPPRPEIPLLRASLLSRGALATFAASLTVLLSAACTGGEDGSSGGIDELPRLVPEEALRIGSREDPDTGFARPVSLDVDRDGQVYVLDAQDLRIRVYSPEGRLLRMIGRRGEGPGEFESAPRFGVMGDTVWATDGFRVVRFTLFDRSGEVLATARADATVVPLHSESTWGIIAPRTFLPGGGVLADLSGFGGGSSMGEPPDLHGPHDTIPVPRLRYDAATGEVVDTIGWTPRAPPRPYEPPDRVSVGSTEYRLPPIPSDQPLFEHLPDGLLTVHRERSPEPGDATFRVVRTDLEGDTVFDRAFPYRPQPYDDAYLDAAAWRTVQLPTGGYRLVNGMPEIPPMPQDSMTIFRAIRPELQFPAFQTPIRQVEVGADGRFWLERADIPGDSVPWVVLEPDGSPVAAVTLPRDRRILWSGGNTLWMSEEDELGVPWVVKYRLRERGG